MSPKGEDARWVGQPNKGVLMNDRSSRAALGSAQRASSDNMTVPFARLIFLVVALLATFAVAHGHPGGKVARLAVLMFDTPATNANLPAFLAGLRDLGYVEGRNVALEYRYAEGRPERVAPSCG